MRLNQKFSFVLFLSLSSLAITAFSADNYTGPYAGIHIGYADGQDKGKEVNNGVYYNWHDETSPSNVLFGAFAGFNKKLENNLLLGIEGDFERRNAKDLSYQRYGAGPLDTSYPVEIKIKNAASLRAKLGYVLNQDKTLVYLTGGVAFADINRKFTSVGDSSAFDSSWQTGWTAGFGAEHFFADKISAKIEYRYSDYGKRTVDGSPMYLDPPGSSLELQEYKNENSLRAGLAYHF